MRRGAMLTALVACTSCDGTSPERACAQARADANLDGSWTLSGKGERRACGQSSLDGAMRFETQTPLAVKQVVSASGPDTLTLATPSTGFSLTGTVQGDCVEVTTVEDLGAAGRLTMRFDGAAAATTIEGTFTGTGPGTCETEGSFDVALVLDDDCNPNPCQHGGVCADGPGSFTCTCAPGYLGPTCENLDRCAPSPCQNGGTCTNVAAGFTCACPVGYSGPTCGADACAPSPCANGGVCSHGPVTFTCSCSPGWTGPTCADVDRCSPSPCLHDGTCRNTGGGFACTCPNGWTGPTCADVDNCWPDPCLNGGHCVDGADSYTCQCPAGYRGTRCETDINECAEGLDNCDPSADCTNTPGSFRCACQSGYAGDGATCTRKTEKARLGGCQGGAATPDATVAVLCGLALALIQRRRRA